VNVTVLVTGVLDVALLAFTVWCLKRSRRRGASLRLRIFVALAGATLAGALVTGLFAVASDATIGAQARLARVVPKAFVLAATLLPLAAAAAALVGRHLARSMEELTEAATRIAEGQRGARLPAGHGGEAQRLARALASMRRELEGKPYAAAFLRDAWHDLKTPVAALRATLEVLEDGAIDEPAAARHFLSNLRLSTEQLDRTLADLVTLARYETATLHATAPAAMSDLVRDAMARVAPLAEARNVVLRTTEAANGKAPNLACDPDALARALGNLLENAVHASPGGTVAVSIGEVPHEGITIDVTNEPSRVPPEIRRALFERPATSRKGEGSGLGLAIARAAVEAHGGRVRFVEMGPPRVTVRVELPR
jgi:two-component system, OmpR family, sensor histidine kinase CreC